MTTDSDSFDNYISCKTYLSGLPVTQCKRECSFCRCYFVLKLDHNYYFSARENEMCILNLYFPAKAVKHLRRQKYLP